MIERYRMLRRLGYGVLRSAGYVAVDVVAWPYDRARDALRPPLTVDQTRCTARSRYGRCSLPAGHYERAADGSCSAHAVFRDGRFVYGWGELDASAASSPSA